MTGWVVRVRAVAAVLLLLFSASLASAAQVEGVRFQDRLTVGETTLTLRGTALLRYRVVFRAYVAALYLPSDTPASRVLADVPRRLEIEYFWAIPADGFVEATLEGIRKNVDVRTWKQLRPEIDRFNQLYADVEPGDRYELTYLPGHGTELALNGFVRGRIEGAEFASALFSIWLGQQPFDASLKNQLLGAE